MGTFIAGFLGGTVMGMVFITHLSLLFTFRPPASFARRAAESGVTRMVMTATVAALFLWSGLGVAAAFIAEAVPHDGLTVPGVPSVPYTLFIVWLAVLIAIPAALFMRDRLFHVVAELLLFAGIFGWVIPLLVREIS